MKRILQIGDIVSHVEYYDELYVVVVDMASYRSNFVVIRYICDAADGIDISAASSMNCHVDNLKFVRHSDILKELYLVV